MTVLMIFFRLWGARCVCVGGGGGGGSSNFGRQCG